MKYTALISLVAALGSASAAALAADGKSLVEAQCASCHALTEINYGEQAVTERAERKAPPLYYAGNKFRREWLVDWLQNPVRIRPAGYFPPAHVVDGEDGDVVDAATLTVHPKLGEKEAVAAADYLMSLTPYTARLEATGYEPGTISWKMGNMNFGKFNGCDACHRDAPDFGGLSGPELYTAWQRLQPKFIASFIESPVAWDPHTLMPDTDLNAAAIKRLVDYLKVNGEDQP
ncbi:MAG TPA: c-type cytochrome [Spongiibacteraceae bacterium]|jgi:mono/diheme cytochrome c family protein|nr:c-type cytochrome [Spongiibacteraceae bacterium]HUH38681.1 c-type cytochrome [Spongiibacteraceae bacterium]